jgi:hypothetical protein
MQPTPQAVGRRHIKDEVRKENGIKACHIEPKIKGDGQVSVLLGLLLYHGLVPPGMGTARALRFEKDATSRRARQ